MMQRDPIEEELQAHFEALAEERLEAGDTPEQAARFARHRLGHQSAIEEEVRSLREMLGPKVAVTGFCAVSALVASSHATTVTTLQEE